MSFLAADPLPLTSDNYIYTADVIFVAQTASQAAYVECAIYIGPIFQPLFQRSVDTGVIHSIWETSIMASVPKMLSLLELSHFRLVAVTSIIM